MPDSIGRFQIGAVRISDVDMESALDEMYRLVAAREGGYFAFTCAHGIVDSEKDVRLRAILNESRLTLPDGMPLVWLGRAKGKAVRRVTAPDFFEAAMRDSRSRAIRHYFYGGSPATVERIATRARDLLGPGAVAGRMSPPMRPAGASEDIGVLEEIAAAKPDVIWVGLVCPSRSTGWPGTGISSAPLS
jgi:N-acetylglucosaminyldiphosphoundecaprenol N-acetyl-beta-D-mannosaminyltransferase